MNAHNHTISKFFTVGAAALMAFVLSVSPAHAYFGDIERSNGNAFDASSLGIALLTDGTGDYREISVTADAEENVEYRLVKAASGAFCADLSVLVKRGDTVLHDGPMSGFTASAVGPLAAGGTEEWILNLDAASGSGTCTISWSFEANQGGYAHGTAFFDTETDVQVVTAADFGIAPPAPAFADDVVISEIMYDPDGTDTTDNGGEWIEVYNGSSTVIDLTEWTLFENGTDHGINSYGGSQNLAPGQYAIVANDAALFSAAYGGTLYTFDSSFSFGNDAGTLELRNASGTPVHDKTYDSTDGASNDGNSLQRESGDGWCAGAPTPGIANVCASTFAATAYTFASAPAAAPEPQKNASAGPPPPAPEEPEATPPAEPEPQPEPKEQEKQEDPEAPAKLPDDEPDVAKSAEKSDEPRPDTEPTV